MSNHDDFDEQPTPDPSAPIAVSDQPSGLTDSQREWFEKRFASRVPAVQPRETPRPHHLMARTTTPDELDLIRHFRLAGDQVALAEFTAKLFAEHRQLRRDLNAKIEADSSDNQAALEELRALLSRPPNGRVAALQTRVDDVERTLASLGSDDRVQDLHLESLKGDASFAKRAAQSVIVFLVLSIGAAAWFLGTEVEKLNSVIDDVKDLKRQGVWHQPKDTK